MDNSVYKKSGVNIDANNESNERIKPHVRSTFTKDVLADVGLFGGIMSIEWVKEMKHPALVLSMDGVGTKTKIARMLNKYDTIGVDIVHHSINDILVQGGKGLFFLDYVASDNLRPKIVEEIVKGMAIACKKAGIVLIGGETAEMPSVYLKDEHDVVGCIGGIVEKDDIIKGQDIVAGDILYGLRSSGLHTSGYSLARYVLFDTNKISVNKVLDGMDMPIGEALLVPHREYASLLLPILKKVKIKGMAHITGGGFIDNIPRILPKGCGAKIDKKSWQVPVLFKHIVSLGKVSEGEAYKTLNMGIGMVLALDKKEGKKFEEECKKAGETVYKIGEVIRGNGVQIS